MKTIQWLREWWDRPVSLAVGGVVFVMGVGSLVGVMALIPFTDPSRPSLSDGDAMPVVCMDDGTLMLHGSVGGREGVWMLPGRCVQTGRQEPLCEQFVPYGEAEQSICVLAVGPDGREVYPSHSEVS